MIQDTVPHTYDPIFRRKKPEGRDYLLHYEYNKVMLLGGEKGSAAPAFGELREEWDFPEQAQCLFSIDDRAYYCVTDMAMSEFGGFYMEPLTTFRNFEPPRQAFMGITGSQLYRQTQNRRFRGRCGSKTEPSIGGRAPVYPSYGQTEYPKISPAVIMAITSGDKLLMSRHAGGAYRNYALTAGFVGTGETLEDCIRREVMEEMGFRVKNIRYYKSQPWAFSDMGVVGFTAGLSGSNAACLEEEELCEVGWFTRDEIVEYGPCVGAGYEMMKASEDGKIQQAAT